MSVEENKAIVRLFLSKFPNADISGLLNMMTDDATWWIGGKPELFPLAGTKTKKEMAILLGDLITPMPNGLEMRVKSIIGEGDRIAAEIESYGQAANGRIYNNDYHFLFIVKDGKIAHVKEYLDPMHTKAVFIDP